MNGDIKTWVDGCYSRLTPNAGNGNNIRNVNTTGNLNNNNANNTNGVAPDCEKCL